MKTAQPSANRYKKIILTTGFVAVTTVFSVLSTKVSAQSLTNPSVSNPFVPNTTNTQPERPVLYTQTPTTISNDPTNATKTIAQDQIAITAIPPRMGDDNTLTGAPGEKIQVQLRVRNISEQPVTITTSAQDFILDIDGETPVAIDDSGSNRWSLASWLTITPTEHVIQPKATVGLNVLIEIPEDALPGGHYAMVLHEPGQGASSGLTLTQEGAGAAINQRVGTLLYVLVDGPINEEAYVRDFTFPSFSEYGPVPFSFTVENNSDVHITPQISVEIYNLFNQRVDTIPVTPKNIFPLTAREFTGNWNRVWGWGMYTAKLTMSYGSAGSVVVSNVTFWLLPIKIILSGLALILIFVFMGLAIKRHLQHRQKQNEKRIAELEHKIEEMQTIGETERRS